MLQLERKGPQGTSSFGQTWGYCAESRNELKFRRIAGVYRVCPTMSKGHNTAVDPQVWIIVLENVTYSVQACGIFISTHHVNFHLTKIVQVCKIVFTVYMSLHYINHIFTLVELCIWCANCSRFHICGCIVVHTCIWNANMPSSTSMYGLKMHTIGNFLYYRLFGTYWWLSSICTCPQIFVYY